MHFQFVLFDGFDPLDIIAPFEVIAAASDFAHDDDAVIEMVSSGEPPRPFVSGTRGLTISATSQLDPTLPGYIFVPGASGLVEGDPDDGVETVPVIIARAAQTVMIPPIQQALTEPGVTVTTVCGGSLILAMAGILEGRTATTHVLGLDVLDAAGVNMLDARVVVDGDLISGGGVTSGLDVALFVVEQHYGPVIAHKVEVLFQYERRGTTLYAPTPTATPAATAAA